MKKRITWIILSILMVGLISCNSDTVKIEPTTGPSNYIKYSSYHAVGSMFATIMNDYYRASLYTNTVTLIAGWNIDDYISNIGSTSATIVLSMVFMNDSDKGLVPGVYYADSTPDDGNLISAQAIYYPLGTDTDSTFTMDLKSGTVTVTEDGDGYKIITDLFSETGDSVSSYFIGILYDFNTSR